MNNCSITVSELTLSKGDILYLDVYSGSFSIGKSECGEDVANALSITPADHEIWWHRRVGPGQTITFDNQYYDGNIISNEIYLHGRVVEPTVGFKTAHRVLVE